MTGTYHSSHLVLAHADEVQQRTIGGTGELARAAFDARHDIFFLYFLKVSVSRDRSQQVRLKPHGADGHALGATYARLYRATPGFPGIYDNDARRALHYRHIGIGQRLAHHGAAADDFAGILGQTAACLNQQPDRSTYADQQVGGFRQRLPGHGHDTFEQGLVLLDSLVHGKSRPHVLHHRTPHPSLLARPRLLLAA